MRVAALRQNPNYQVSVGNQATDLPPLVTITSPMAACFTALAASDTGSSFRVTGDDVTTSRIF